MINLHNVLSNAILDSSKLRSSQRDGEIDKSDDEEPGRTTFLLRGDG